MWQPCDRNVIRWLHAADEWPMKGEQTFPLGVTFWRIALPNGLQTSFSLAIDLRVSLVCTI